MNRWLRFLFGVVALAVAFAVGNLAARAETCRLELKRLGSLSGPSDAVARQLRFLCQVGSTQRSFMQIGTEGAGQTPQEAEFARIVKKEPKYASAHPFRGTLKFGTQTFAYAFDTKDAKSDAYSRMYFDLKHSGDLSEQKPIEGKSQGVFPGGGGNYQFPRVDLTLDLDGTKVDYAFLVSLYSSTAGDFKYASVSFMSAAYREGHITVAGKKRHVYLLDYNCNGRFDDEIAVQKNVQGAGGQLFFRHGDLLLIDPDPNDPKAFSYNSIESSAQQYVSKLLAIDGKFYALKVSPAGDELTLTPSVAPLGSVSSPHEGFRGALWSDLGYVRVECGGAKQAAVPAGKWNLATYTIDRTGWREPPETEPAKNDAGKQKAGAKAEPEGGSVLEALLSLFASAAVAPTRSGNTMVSAAAAKDCPPITVRPGQTAALPFGPPYKPVVTASPQFVPPGDAGKEAQKQISLQLSLVGAGGEVCNNLLINGGRPDGPKFTIYNAKDAIVQQGTFKYG